MKKKRKYYSSCEFLPLWNFFKVNSGEQQNFKYLIVLNDRMEYDSVEVDGTEQEYLEKQWAKIFEEYDKLERNYSAANFLSDKSRVLYFYAIYLQEQSMFKSLLYVTNVRYIRFLRSRGYELANTSQEAYWRSLREGLAKVEQHITYIEILKSKIKDLGEDSKKEANPFDATMAWIASNGIEVSENLTVSRFIKIKEIILRRIKAKQQENTKSRLYGGGA